MVKHNVQEERLSFTTNTAEAVKAGRWSSSPSARRQAGRQRGPQVRAGRRARRQQRRQRPQDHRGQVTVPVGTAAKVRPPRRLTKHKITVVSNPEFLKEGAAIDDFMKPDRVVIGTEDEHSTEVMTRTALRARQREQDHHMDVPSAELSTPPTPCWPRVSRS
jgi:UDPglucose 6-dehydrogenase